LNFFVFKFISKEISWAEHEYMNIHTHPINALVMPLCLLQLLLFNKYIKCAESHFLPDERVLKIGKIASKTVILQNVVVNVFFCFWGGICSIQFNLQNKPLHS
jgi:uncharacterized membrane protein